MRGGWVDNSSEHLPATNGASILLFPVSHDRLLHVCNKPVNRDHRRFDERRSESGVFQVNGRQADGDALSRRGSTEPPAAQFLSLAILLPFLPLLSHRIKPENDLERDTIDKSVCIYIYISD